MQKNNRYNERGFKEAMRVLNKYVEAQGLESEYDVTREIGRCQLAEELARRKALRIDRAQTKYITYEVIYERYNPIQFSNWHQLELFARSCYSQTNEYVRNTQNKEIRQNQQRQYESEEEYKKERHKRSYIERTASKKRRDDAINEIIGDDIHEYTNSNPQITEFNSSSRYKEKDSVMIVNVSDIHYGKCVDVGINQINKLILEQRINDYANECIDKIKMFNPKKVIIAILGDCIEGLIHTSSRAESDIPSANVQATQIGHVLWNLFAKPIAEVANSTLICGVSGNHGRSIASKNDVTNQDTLFSITMQTLTTTIELSRVKNGFTEQKLSMEKNYYFDETNKFCHPNDYTYTRITLFDKKIMLAFTHGDKIGGKNGDKWLARISRGKRNPDYVFAGHYHSNEMKTSANGCKIYFNGSICGADTYATHMGLVDKPSQKIFLLERITTPNIDGGITETFKETEFTIPLIYGWRGTEHYDSQNDY